MVGHESVEGGMELLLQYAQLIKHVDEDFKYKKEIGEKVEVTFKNALISSGINLSVVQIKHNGIGSHDFEITNNLNQKKFYIELKSYSNTSGFFQLAPSQADFGSKHPENYCLATIFREEKITEDYIKQNLISVNYINRFVENGLSDYESFKSIKESNKIHLTLRDAIRINVPKEQINEFKMSFNEMINKIKIHLV